MIARDIDIPVTLTYQNRLIERRTGVHGRLKKIGCKFDRQARARHIPKLFGLNIKSVLVSIFGKQSPCWLFSVFFGFCSLVSAQTVLPVSDAEVEQSAPAFAELPVLMSLAQSLKLANTRHPDVLKHEAELQAGQAALQYAGLDNRWEAHIELTARTAELQVFDRGYSNDSRTKFIVSKMLWDFGRSSGQNERANLGIESAEIGLDYARRLQRIQIMQRFFEVLAADYQFAADNEAMSLAFFPFSRAEERSERFGSVSELEVMEKRVDYFDELQQRNQSLQAQRSSRLRLALAMGRPRAQPDGLIEPDLTAYERELPDFDDLLEQVLAASPLIKQKEVELAQLRSEELQINADKNPSLYLDLQAADYAQDYRVRDQMRASLTLDIPLLAGGVTAVEHAGLLARISSKEAEVLALDYEVREQVLEWVQHLEMLKQQIGQDVQNLEYRERALDKSRLLYEQEVSARIGQAQADMAKLLWLDAQAKFQRVLIWEQIDAVLGAPEVSFE